MRHRRRHTALVLPAACVLALTAAPAARAQGKALPKLRVSDDQRSLVRADGKAFFYLADTAWELFHRLDRKQVLQYLDKRAAQKYTAIQAVALAELEGIEDPNAQGDLPLVDKDPARPATTPGASPADAKQYDYWDHVDYVIDEANRRGLYMALLPTWARWVTDERGKIFTPQNAEAYGQFLGKRYGNKGVIWVLGGDRRCEGTEPVWRAFAKGIALGVSGKEDYDAALMTFHPAGGTSSSQCFHDDKWLDFNMHQTGHSRAEKARQWSKIGKDYSRSTVKPVLDGEPLYEDHPVEFNAKEFGYSFDAHVRQRAYWSVFSGSTGHTYGNHSVWQMFSLGKKPINGPLLPWSEAINRPGAAQMTYVRALVESRPMLGRVPDQGLVTDALEGADHVAATRGDGFAFYYSAMGRKFTVNLGRLAGTQVVAWWFNPRTGVAEKIGTWDNHGTRDVTCPSEGFGSDWVLVLDEIGRKVGPPGQAKL
jgi:hypothetical protein